MSTTLRARPKAPTGSDGNGDGDGDGPSPERVTVNLTAVTVAALLFLIKLSGDTKTDAINKAVQFYGEIRKLIERGGAVYIREPGESDMERVKIF